MGHPVLGGPGPSHHGLHCPLGDVPCQAGLVLAFVLFFHTQSCFFPPFQANIGQKEDFEAARKKALALGAKKVTVSFLPGSWGV